MATFCWHLEEIILSDQLFCDTPTQQKALASRGSPLDQNKSEGELTWWLVTLSSHLSLPFAPQGESHFPKGSGPRACRLPNRAFEPHAQRSPSGRGGSSGTLARHDALKLTTVLIRI